MMRPVSGGDCEAADSSNSFDMLHSMAASSTDAETTSVLDMLVIRDIWSIRLGVRSLKT